MSEISKIYLATCQAYNRTPSDEAALIWEKVLSPYSGSEIEQAITLHAGNVAPAEDGRVIGRWMPTPAEVKSVIEQLSHEAENRRLGKYVSCGDCRDGWIRVTDKKADELYGTPGHSRVTRCQCFLNWAATKTGETPRKAVARASRKPVQRQQSYEAALETQKALEARIKALDAKFAMQAEAKKPYIPTTAELAESLKASGKPINQPTGEQLGFNELPNAVKAEGLSYAKTGHRDL